MVISVEGKKFGIRSENGGMLETFLFARKDVRSKCRWQILWHCHAQHFWPASCAHVYSLCVYYIYTICVQNVCKNCETQNQGGIYSMKTIISLETCQSGCVDQAFNISSLDLLPASQQIPQIIPFKLRLTPSQNNGTNKFLLNYGLKC